MLLISDNIFGIKRIHFIEVNLHHGTPQGRMAKWVKDLGLITLVSSLMVVNISVKISRREIDPTLAELQWVPTAPLIGCPRACSERIAMR